MNKNNHQDGFVMTIVLLLIALLVLRYAFDIDVLEYLKPVWEWFKSLWERLMS